MALLSQYRSVGNIRPGRPGVSGDFRRAVRRAGSGQPAANPEFIIFIGLNIALQQTFFQHAAATFAPGFIKANRTAAVNSKMRNFNVEVNGW
ncbi:MAG: hypothetical protein ABSH48_06250 [Verrucomicrobiota bacterium]